MHSHEYVFERLSARTELFHGLAPLRRQAEQLVHKLVECLMGSSRRRVRSKLSPWALRAGEEEEWVSLHVHALGSLCKAYVVRRTHGT